MAPVGPDSEVATRQVYWRERGQPWRTRPEIAAARQADLTARLAAYPFAEGQKTFAFADVRLTRAEVEWLLASHDSGRGPVNWADEGQRERRGIDLRGADLHGEDLSGLPLANLLAGPERVVVNSEDEYQAGAEIHLDGARLERVVAVDADLRDASLVAVRLEHADLSGAHLERADLREAHLEDAMLAGAHLAGTDLRRATLDPLSRLEGASFGAPSHGYALLGAVRWGGTDLTGVDWAPVLEVGDEREAKRRRTRDGVRKSRATRLAEYNDAIKSYRRLSLVLQQQGLSAPASQCAYRAQVVRRRLLWRQVVWRGRMRSLGPYFFASLLGTLTGYGYRMWRILAANALLVCCFAAAYFALGFVSAPHLAWYDALFVSLTAFHGRVFVEAFLPGTIQIWLTAAEAVCDLLVESIFIAMLARRFLG
jgi:uncharacterized protein YjbI with pentapeptide repeats